MMSLMVKYEKEFQLEHRVKLLLRMYRELNLARILEGGCNVCVTLANSCAGRSPSLPSSYRSLKLRGVLSRSNKNLKESNKIKASYYLNLLESNRLWAQVT